MPSRAMIVVAGLIAVVVTTSPCAAWAESGGAPPRPNEQALVGAAQRAYAAARARFDAGAEALEVVYAWSLRWLEAQRRVQPAAARAAAREHRSRVTEVCELARRRVELGALDVAAREACAYYRIEADLLVGETP